MKGRHEKLQRQGGRGAEEFREACTYRSVYIYCIHSVMRKVSRVHSSHAGLEQTVLGNAQGSSCVEFGGTKVLVGVFGPRERQTKDTFLASGALEVDVEIVRFPAKPKVGPKRVSFF